jgi:hypothetical protein
LGNAVSQARRITLRTSADEQIYLYYQINYTLTDVPDDAAYFHAQFRRTNPLPYKEVYTILDGVKGRGQYVGTYMAWGVNNTGWWGEGEIKFYLDGDGEFPTICGTGTEDYFCGAYNFDGGTRSATPGKQLPGIHHALRRPAAGDPPDGVYNRRALRHVSLAHHGPGPLRAGPARHDPGARLARTRTAAICRCRTTSPRWPSGTRRCRPRRFRRCRTATIWKSSDATDLRQIRRSAR